MLCVNCGNFGWDSTGHCYECGWKKDLKFVDLHPEEVEEENYEDLEELEDLSEELAKHQCNECTAVLVKNSNYCHICGNNIRR